MCFTDQNEYLVTMIKKLNIKEVTQGIQKQISLLTKTLKTLNGKKLFEEKTRFSL